MGYRICGKPSSQMEWGSDKAQKQPDEKALLRQRLQILCSRRAYSNRSSVWRMVIRW